MGCNRIIFHELLKKEWCKRRKEGKRKMKKAMLYISLIMSVVYAVTVGLVIALQEPIRNAQGIYGESEVPFMIPVPNIFICIVMIAAAIVFNILLQRAVDDIRTNIETVVVIVFSVLIVLMPWIFNLAMVMQVRYYSLTAGAMEVAACSVLQQGITACNPFLVLAMLLQIIHAGISLGKKGR